MLLLIGIQKKERIGGINVMNKEFFSVHTHTEASNFSLRDSLNKPEDLLDYAIELELPGLAITDHSTISSHIRAARHIENNPEKFKDFTLGFGDEIYLVDRETIETARENNDKVSFPHFLVLAKNQRGYEFL